MSRRKLNEMYRAGNDLMGNESVSIGSFNGIWDGQSHF